MNFESLGMIETKGLLPSIEATDAMLKAADVYLFKKEHAGAGLTMIMILGTVAAVKASLGAGYTAAEKVQEKSVKNICVIPRPDEQVMKVFSKNLKSKIPYPNDGKNLEDPDTWVLDIYNKKEENFSQDSVEENKEEINIKENLEEKELDVEKINLLDSEKLLEFSKNNEAETTVENLKQYRVKDLKDLYSELSDVTSTDLNKMNKSDVIEGIEKELYSK